MEEVVIGRSKLLPATNWYFARRFSLGDDQARRTSIQPKIWPFADVIRHAVLDTDSRCRARKGHMSPGARLILSAIAFCVLTPGVALAQSELLMFGLCRKIPDDEMRLKCFDGIVPAPQTTTDQPQPVREWSIEDSKSSADGSPEVFASLASNDGRSELIIRCKDRKTQLAVSPNGLFAIDRGTVMLQINDGPSTTASWNASSNSKGLFASNATALIKTLPDGGKLFVRATGYNGRQADDATFQLGAITVVKNRISAACKWPPEGLSAPPPPKAGPKQKKK